MGESVPTPEKSKCQYDDVKPGMKRSTWLTKETIIWSKIISYLGQRKVSEITAKDVIDWQNTIRKLKNKAGKPISPTYLKTIHGQLSAIFNHAMKFYDLAANPAQKAGTMGAEESKEMEFWTKEEYLKFSEAMMDKPLLNCSTGAESVKANFSPFLLRTSILRREPCGSISLINAWRGRM